MNIERKRIEEHKGNDPDDNFGSMPGFRIETDGCSEHGTDVFLIRDVDSKSNPQRFNLTLAQCIALGEWAVEFAKGR